MRKIPLLFGLTIYILYRVLVYLTSDVYWSMLIFLIPIGFLVLNSLLRRKLAYKKWFLSKANFLLERKSRSFKSEIPIDILFQKLIAVIEESKFELSDTDESKKCILATTQPNLITWGENIYVEISEQDGESIVLITSVMVYGNYSWDRNDDNYKELFRTFEESLTI